MPNFDFNVFLSHNSRDKDEVIKLKSLLVRRGLSCWLDKHELPPGREFEPLLRTGLENSLAIAVCYGRAGIGPWQENEINIALRIAATGGRPLIPVLLPGAGSEPDLPPYFRDRTWVDFRQGYDDEEVARLEWGITGERTSLVAATTATPIADTRDEEAERRRILREVFGVQYERIREILTQNHELRAILASRFQLSPTDANTPSELFYLFHRQFLEAVGYFGYLYATSDDKQQLLDLVGSILYLALAPETGRGMRVESPRTAGATIEINSRAHDGICLILVCWLQGLALVPKQLLVSEKVPGFFESPPAASIAGIKLSLMDGLGIRLDQDPEEADRDLEDMIRMRDDFQEPVHLTLEESSLLSQIRAPQSRLRKLLVFIKVRAASIDPTRPAGWDRNVEQYLTKLRQILGGR